MTRPGWLRRLCGIAVLMVCAGDAAGAAVIAVDGTTCTLGDAILSANSDSAIGGCSTGAGADTLVLAANVVLTAPVTAAVEGGSSGLPAIASAIAIEAGGGSIIERANALSCTAAEPTAFRIFEVAAGGDLSLVGLTLRNGCVAAVGTGAMASGGAVLLLAGGALKIDGCTLGGNSARGGPEGGEQTAGAARGGAVAALGGVLEIVASTFSDNEVIGFDARGGAVAVEAGNLRAITWSRFESNRASPAPSGVFLSNPNSGGAIALREANAGPLSHLLIAGNLAGRDAASSGVGGAAAGGGLSVRGGRVQELTDVLFSANVARAGGGSNLAFSDGLGGGLANGGSIDTIARATFSANQALGDLGGAGRGGGLDNTGQIGRIVAANLFGNIAQGGLGVHAVQGSSLGGGIANLGSISEIAASSLAGNECPGFIFIGFSAGGGIYNASDNGAPEDGLRLVDTLLAGNLATDGADCFSTANFVSLGFNLVQTPDVSCLLGSPGDIIGEDPQLLGPADNGCTVPLPGGGCAPSVAFPASSPAADAGRCVEAGTEIDGRGAVRPFDLAAVPNAAGGDGCDIGAFELDGALAAVHLGLNVADSADPVASGTGPGNLVYTVALASLGSATASSIAVAVTLPLPAGVTLDAVAPSVGSWDGATWTVGALPSGGAAALTFDLTVGFGTTGGPDVLALAAAVMAATGHNGEFASDLESTTVIEGVFFDGFESADTSAWTGTVGGS
ncbi:MAG: choice-of-anchor Q domain-containing protein [Thermoanaerobaculia bacterium]